jgi:hypothetical protein
MDRTRFERPVSILVGLGYAAKVESASQAYQFLCELPRATANSARSVAAKVCKLAIDGTVEPETARSAFISFARRMAILTDDPLDTELLPSG